jgi:hypothetical protein
MLTICTEWLRSARRSGAPRICYDAQLPLKEVQGRIKGRILRQVVYPSYLTGGLPQRDYLENARMHTSPRVMVNDDIQDFFPTTSVAAIYDTWRHFFHFPPDVARTLTRLTTRKGGLPQGARTSSYLANLAFWAVEPELVRKLHSMGFTYSRYVDDITISAKTDQSQHQLGLAVAMVRRMVERYGLQFGPSKHKLIHAGARMEVTGLIVGDKAAGVTKAKHSAVRAHVHRYERAVSEQPENPETLALKHRVSTVLGQYRRFHRKKADALKQRMTAAAG